ncbi:RDD family protein [Dyadobacter sp. CY312]|uniref:RDD family protein n=1 Tax=Dyadobacter sp. CY312 TaxID=2907303 RepID=UPI001F3F3DED|nr:RDD family protein [Dyadobacter sp. CY312]MCE7039098.1 RDD family protein [Dyadobacter sp. CY312]
MANISKQISVGTRLGSMLLDHFFMTMIAVVFSLPGMIYTFADAFEVTHEQQSVDFLGGSFLYVNLLGFAFYFCKDCIGGQSIVKRILKLRVVDNETGLSASPMKCLVRNLSIVLWPIEALVTLTNTSRRLGDRIAGTKLVVCDKAIEQPRVQIGQVLISVVIAYGLMLLLVLPFKNLISSVEQKKIDFVESSYNDLASKEAEKLFADSLGQYLSASIRVYDQVQNSPSKYISLIIQLKENYLESDQDFERLESLTKPVLFSKFPERTFVGQIKYVYKTGGSIQIRIVPIDWTPQKP